MPLYASGVTLPADLSQSLSGIGANAYNQIGSNYGAAKTKLQNDATARGMNGATVAGPGSYAGTRLAATQGLDTGNLESALGGGLGNTAYQNQLQQRGFQQNEDLARQVAAMNKPDLLQQILGGAGAVGGTAAKIYGAWGANSPSGYPPQSGPSFPQGQSQMNMPFSYPGYANNPYLNGGL